MSATAFKQIRTPLGALALALAVAAAVLGVWLLNRDAGGSSPEDAQLADQRARLESEQRARGLVEVQPARPLPPPR
jgi:hypothetical protein